MKTILVPVDYTATAKNAAYYALGFAKQIAAGKIILYNAFQPPIPVDAMSVTTDGNFNTLGLYDIDELTKSNKAHLETLKQDIIAAFGTDITIETFGEFNTLREGVEEICRSQDIVMIVMGISEAGGLSETLIGSSSLDIAKHITTPVIIVPTEATYKPIAQILFTCDYKNVAETVPVTLLKNIVAATGAHLHVLHIDSNAETEDHLQQAAILKNLLQDLTVDFHNIQHADFKAAVGEFIRQHHIDLLAAIPKKHGFFEGLFHHSHTKELAFHSAVPLLLMMKEHN